VKIIGSRLTKPPTSTQYLPKIIVLNIIIFTILRSANQIWVKPALHVTELIHINILFLLIVMSLTILMYMINVFALKCASIAITC
jgi:hypothetical protein